MLIFCLRKYASVIISLKFFLLQVPPGRELHPDKVDDHRLLMHSTLAQLFTPSIQQAVEFAKRIPSFCQLSQDDQLVLIKMGFFELWLVHSSRMVGSNECSFTFPDGHLVHKQELDFVFSVNILKPMCIVTLLIMHTLLICFRANSFDVK